MTIFDFMSFLPQDSPQCFVQGTFSIYYSIEYLRFLNRGPFCFAFPSPAARKTAEMGMLRIQPYCNLLHIIEVAAVF